MTKIIGFLGVKRSGKDTCGDYLIKNYGFKRYAFGDPVKEVCRNMFNLTDSQLYGEEKEIVDTRWNITPREMFQRIGTKLGQYDFHDLFPESLLKPRTLWIYLFKLWLDKNKIEKVVITDVRFKHEIECIEELGGEIILIERPNLKQIDNHISEKEHIESKGEFMKIVNDKDINDLYTKLDILMYNTFE